MKLKIKNQTINVKDIQVDSRKVKPGDLFIAYKGVNIDAHKFIPQAVANGAKVVIGEIAPLKIKDMLPNFADIKYIQVDDGREAWALLCAQKYNNPEKKLTILGVTGTDGKTTTSSFLYYILKQCGKKVGLISTVKAIYGDKDISTGLHTSTPNPDVLFKILSEMVKDGIKYVVLETTSHGLLQKRVFGITYKVAGITNVTHEHFDIHKTYENLLHVKASIAKMSNVVYLNADGPGYSDVLKHIAPAHKHKVKVSKIVQFPYIKLSKQFFERFPADYNIQNAALAYHMAKELGLSEECIIAGLSNASPPAGRFEQIKNNLGINIVVDFAHTPNSMKSVLEGVYKLKKNTARIIVVFGAAGERDAYKRRLMGEIASKLADVTVLTSEDPRSEDPNEIILQIKAGNSDFPFITEPDRKRAIKLGISLAHKDDWVLILGKGHEKSMNIKGVEYPWSDIDAVKQILSEET